MGKKPSGTPLGWRVVGVPDSLARYLGSLGHLYPRSRVESLCYGQVEG